MRRKCLTAVMIALLAFCIGMLIGHLSRSTMTEDEKFENYTDDIFKAQIQSNTINLHYTLADPSKYGIHNYPVTLGEIDVVAMSKDNVLLEQEKNTLTQFDYNALSAENQLTYDILKLSLETDKLLGSNYLLTEPLSATLGIQAQLPILLAEYPFRCKEDVEDYVELVTLMDVYFQQIIEYEQAKSEAGLFMNETGAGRIIAQCESFIENADSNYLLSVFEDKLSECDFLSKKQKLRFTEKHTQAIKEHLIPAYQMLIESLKSLKNTGKNPYGLSHYTGGQEYYEYLVKSTTGIYDDISLIEDRLKKQLQSDFSQLQRILKVNPQITVDLETAMDTNSFSSDPQKILDDLQEKMSYDFPSLKNVDYSIKYVHPDLEEYLSPAFYLTPPFDALSPNSIYLNNNSQFSETALYTTLAHEGFPGHLYQTQYFSQTNPSPIRYLLNTGGYVEGWATYVESYAYQYAPLSQDMGELLWLNRSVNLCLYSLTDIGIHYHGWTPEATARFLNVFGITDKAVVEEIYQCIVEDPANYLQYYLGCLYFIDLRDSAKEQLGSDFDLQEFHKNVLEIGAAPFPILEKYVLDVKTIPSK